jgi:hypothetical protein
MAEPEYDTVRLERFPLALAHETRFARSFRAFRSRDVHVPKRRVESAMSRSGESSCANHSQESDRTRFECLALMPVALEPPQMRRRRCDKRPKNMKW